MGCNSSKQNAQPAAEPKPTDSVAKGDNEKLMLLTADAQPEGLTSEAKQQDVQPEGLTAGDEAAKKQDEQPAGTSVKEVDLNELWARLQEVEGDQASQDDLFQKLQSPGACMIVTVEIEEGDVIRRITILQYVRAMFAARIWNAEVRLVKSDGNRFFIFASSPGEALRSALSMKLLLSTFHTWIGEVCPSIGALPKPATMKAGIHAGGILLIPEDCFGDPVNVASKLGEDIANSSEIIASASSGQHASMKELMAKFNVTSKETTISGLSLEYNILEVKDDAAVPAIGMPSGQEISAHIKSGNDASEMTAQKYAIMTTDMSGFTRLTKTYGILHFIRLVMKARDIVLPEMAKVGGFKVKYEGDNIIAAFPNPDVALSCVKECARQIQEYNATREKDFQVRIGFGLDFGEVKIMGEDIIGETFESSFKLAEDLAEVGEVLVTETMKAQCSTSIESSGKLSDCKEVKETGCKYYILVFPAASAEDAEDREQEFVIDEVPQDQGSKWCC